MLTALLLQGSEGSPNFCFGLYRNGRCMTFIQSDWDYAPLASNLGWVPCPCRGTDGTVDCAHKTASDMLDDAFNFLSARAGRRVPIGDDPRDHYPDAEWGAFPGETQAQLPSS